MAGPIEISVRPPCVGDGQALAELWHTLWHEHEAFGGYPHTRDPEAWSELGARLDGVARMRGDRFALGQHLHVVAESRGHVVGQVEGWLNLRGSRRLGRPQVCEVRSLVVRSEARGAGIGVRLLDALATCAMEACGHDRIALAAEVFELNRARSFYEKLDYREVARTLSLDTRQPRPLTDTSIRNAEPRHARGYARLWSAVCRERAAFDPRFLDPRAFDACALERLTSLFERGERSGHHVLVREDDRRVLTGAITVTTHPLEMPFAPATRAFSTALVVDARAPFAQTVYALLSASRVVAHDAGASRLEIADLSHDDGKLIALLHALGATPISRTMIRVVSR